MKDLFKHVGKVTNTNTFNDLSDQTNKVVQENMLLANQKMVTRKSNAAKLTSYDNYVWEQTAVDAMIVQTSNAKVIERTLQDVTSDELMKLVITKEKSIKGVT